ncbi:hypothetical protein HYDPIDRAFT_75479, partial [Hydnomerulius pinastri MD-312]
DIEELPQLHPADGTQGLTFDTGDLSAFPSQFKRIPAFQGDAVFQGPHHFFLQSQSGKQIYGKFM